MAIAGEETEHLPRYLFNEGDIVEAQYPRDKGWYRGVIEKAMDEVTYNVSWDEPEDDHMQIQGIKMEMRPVDLKVPPKVGDKVQGFWGEWLDAEITRHMDEGQFKIKWEPPHDKEEDMTCEVRIRLIKRAKPGTWFQHVKEKDLVRGKFPIDGQYYDGVCKEDKGDGSFLVKWDEIYAGVEETVLQARDIKLKKRKWNLGPKKAGADD